MEEEHIWTSDSSNSMISFTLGRVMNTLLTSRPKKLEDAISRLGSGSQRSSGGSLEESLCILRKYVRDAVEKEEQLDQILVPMIENSLKWKDSRKSNQVMILLNWLFQDELLFQAIATNLVKIIMRKDDRYIALGWCTLIRGLVDHGITMSQSSNIGIQEKHQALLKILCSSISHLSSIICNGSKLQDGFELPTRLSVAAADCILVLTEAVTRNTSTSGVLSMRKNSQGSANMEMEFLLWDHLDELNNLALKLLAWSRKSRPLHAKGLEQVLKWLEEIKGNYSLVQDEAGGDLVKIGVSLLSSCWKHYGMLLRLEDHRFSKNYMEMLNQYMSGIQFYTMDYTDEHSGNKDGGIETRKFFLSCISLLLGRLDSKQFGFAMSEQGLQLSRNLFEKCVPTALVIIYLFSVLLKLQCVDEDVIEGAVCILRATIFKISYSSTESSLLDNQQMEEVLPLLLRLLDERDNIARAVVSLIAEYCSTNTDCQCLQEVFNRLASGNPLQRRNAIDVISELVRVSSDAGNSLPLSIRKDLTKHLIDRLGDEELIIRVQSSNLVPMIDPQLVLPELVRLVYSPDERVRSSASDALAAVLKSHNNNPELIVMLLDCLSNLSQSPGLPRTPVEGGGSKFDSDTVLSLVPEWSKSVQDWNIFVKPLVDKLFSEPSNVIIVLFLSYISEHLAEAPDVVLCHVLLYMQGQKEIDTKLLSKGAYGTDASVDSSKLKDSLFDRLCPLLIIRLLPLKVFDDLNSSIMYGQLLNQEIVHGMFSFSYLAFNKYEFEDVRKLAAELCGRVHPQVLFPIIQSHLENATSSRDILKIKACLFAICTSLALRGSDPSLHPVMLEIRKILEMVLLWPSLDGDEVSKAQHGCIDCLALMICSELQPPESSKDSTRNKIKIVGKEKSSHEDVAVRNSVLTYVIQQLTHDKNESEESVLLSFRLCMANVIISACQKISSHGKKRLAKRILPVLIHSVEVLTDSNVRAACIQILFSVVYHLKLAVLPYASDLLRLSVKALREGSDKEKMVGVKLMASLMASEDTVLESISDGLLEASSLLSSITLTNNTSLELRQVCEKLRVSFTSQCIPIPVSLSKDVRGY
ncbi:hypothetical protein BVC80_9069g4 [Macleaya cordata]|uniref:Armadillo-like helical n=1 Tax=Macleaya cordata TaxID=56857 RepID=A0A200PNX7_MACCD|nr:hypothetical protein BVC80_9069g4 [Macleaya cordata]